MNPWVKKMTLSLFSSVLELNQERYGLQSIPSVLDIFYSKETNEILIVDIFPIKPSAENISYSRTTWNVMKYDLISMWLIIDYSKVYSSNIFFA